MIKFSQELFFPHFFEAVVINFIFLLKILETEINFKIQNISINVGNNFDKIL